MVSSARSARGPALLSVIAAGVALVVVALALVVARVVLRQPECVVKVGHAEVELSRAEADRAARVVAPRLRPGPAARALVRRTSLSPSEARVAALALTGHARHSFTCRASGRPAPEPDRLDGHGLTHRAEEVRRAIEAAYGPVPLGGFAPGGVHTGHMPGSAHYEGRAVDAFFRPIGPRDKQRGWALAHYLVARAARFDIATVIFDARVWTASRSAEGWRVYRVDVRGKPARVARVLEHRDHVHVDVFG